MEQEILKKLEEQDKKIDAIFKSVERTRAYFKWTLIVTLVVTVLPVLGLIFAIPYYLQTVVGQYQSILQLRILKRRRWGACTYHLEQ
jgi:hypothetical protein